VDYLPKGQGNSKQFGGISVTVKQITEKADYVLTILSIVDGKVKNTFFLLSNFQLLKYLVSVKINQTILSIHS